MKRVAHPRPLLAFGLLGVGLVLAAVAAAVVLAFVDSDGSDGGDDWPAGFDVQVGYLQVGKPVQATISVGDNPEDNLILYYVRQPSGEVWALVGIDPHSGCQVPWERDYDRTHVNGTGTGVFKAFCSGSVFDLDGSAMFGPAPRGLDRAVVTVKANGDDAYLDLTRFILGVCRSGGSGVCSPEGSPIEVTQLPKASAESAYARSR